MKYTITELKEALEALDEAVDALMFAFSELQEPLDELCTALIPIVDALNNYIENTPDEVWQHNDIQRHCPVKYRAPHMYFKNSYQQFKRMMSRGRS